MMHLIALAKVAGDEFAYHYATDDVAVLAEKKAELRSIPQNLRSFFAVHMLQTDSADFASVQKMDPYFASTEEIKTVPEFIARLQKHATLTTVDVASFIQHKYQLNAFVLQKIVYYVYAELLIRLKQPPFKASFIAYERGPVDEQVRRAHKQAELPTLSTELGKKIFLLQNRKQYFEVIDEIVAKYRQYFSDAWDDESKNLTHKAGTPWSRAHQRGYNAPITDDEIIKFHYLETV